MRARLVTASFVFVVLVTLAACGEDKGVGSADTANSDTGGASCQNDQECVGQVTLVACREAICNTMTHRCEAKALDNDTPCSTGNACKVDEVCTNGTCGGGGLKPTDCGARVCGEDACGHSCGNCQSGETCTAAGACEGDPTACGDITFEGCCTADGRLKYCLDGVLDVIACNENETRATCGWLEGSGGYDCSEQGEPSSDSDTYPYLCPGEVAPADPCGERACGYAAGEACGAKCTDGTACTPEGTCTDPCVDKQCGTYNGKSCGTCDDGEVCTSAGQCEVDHCGNLGFEGCCDGEVTYWCDDNQVLVEDCREKYDTGCGWVPLDPDSGDGEYYYCDGQGADPSETLALDCTDYHFEKPGETVEPSPEPGPEPTPESTEETTD